MLLPFLLSMLVAIQAPRTPSHHVSRSKHARRAARVPAIAYTTPANAGSLAADLGSMIDRAALGRGKWGVMVVSLTNGDTLFNRNADVQLLPASTMKLFTSAVALDRLGAGSRFQTEVLRNVAVGLDGVLHGDLVLRGSGDPTLSGKTLADATEPPMSALARQIADAGIKRVTGAIVGDASAFEERRVPDGWRKRYMASAYAARVSALSFNENKIGVIVRPAGTIADLSFRPPVSGMAVSNEVKIVRGSRGARVYVREDSSGRLRVSGWIGSASRPRDYQVMIERPELYAAGALRAALVARGVAVDGPVRSAIAPPGSTRLTTLASPTLDRIITHMNGESNNHYAELLFRSAARDVGVAGSAENANILLRRFLYEKANVPPTMVFAADGSGLSTLDRVTPRAMVQLLGYVRRAPWGPVLEQSLPVAGKTETLRHRMRYTPAMGNLHAKTGTTNDVASLGGFVTAKNGEQLVFSFIYNGTSRWRAKEAMDAMGATLASFSR